MFYDVDDTERLVTVRAIRRKPPVQEKDDFFYARLTQIIRGAAADKTEEGGFRRYYTEVRATPDMIRASLLPEAAGFCSSGVLTPDHAIRTKNKWAFVVPAAEDEPSLKEEIGKAVRIDDALGRYIEFAKASFPRGLTLEGFRIVVDCALRAQSSITELTPELLAADPRGAREAHG